MSSAFFECQFEDCKQFGKVQYVEYSLFKRHLARDHDMHELLQLAFQKGIIEDPIRYHNSRYVIQQIAEISKMPRKWN